MTGPENKLPRTNIVKGDSSVYQKWNVKSRNDRFSDTDPFKSFTDHCGRPIYRLNWQVFEIQYGLYHRGISNNSTACRGLSLLMWINFNPNMDKQSYTRWSVGCSITYPFPNFNGCTVEVWEWISNSIFTYYDKYNYLSTLELKLIHVCNLASIIEKETLLLTTRK